MPNININITDETKAILHNYRIMHRKKNISLTFEAIIAEWKQSCDTARHNNTIPDSIESATKEQQEA